MAAANTDLLRKKKSRFATTLNGGIGSGDTTITLNSTSGLPTDTAITLTIDRVDANGVSQGSKIETVIGVVSASTLTNCVRGADSTTAQSHSSAAVVEDLMDAKSWDDLIVHLLKGHDQAGSHTGADLYAADAGSNDTYVVTLAPVPLAYSTGMIVRFKANTINTGAATLNVNGLGAKSIVKDGNTALSDGEIIAGSIVEVIYDGTSFYLIGPKTPPGIVTYTPSAAGTATLDLAVSGKNFITMPAGNITIALSNAKVGQVFFIRILQDGTGSRTVTWFTTIRWSGGSAPTLTTTASKADLLVFLCTGSGTYDGFVAGPNI